MSNTLTELYSQPGVWLDAAELASDVAQPLPAAGQRVALFGCGTLAYMARAAARLRDEAG